MAASVGADYTCAARGRATVESRRINSAKRKAPREFLKYATEQTDYRETSRI
jgi:hypothetical protein